MEQLFDYPPENQTIDVNVKIQLANENLLTKGERRKRRHDEKGKWIKYEVGQLVLVRRHDLSSAQDKEIKKFFLLYEGPYEVIEIKMNNTYVLQNQTTQETVGTQRDEFKAILGTVNMKSNFMNFNMYYMFSEGILPHFRAVTASTSLTVDFGCLGADHGWR